MDPIERIVECYHRYKVSRMKRLFASCGQDVYISPHIIVWPESGLRIGHKSAINSFTHIFATGGVTIGSNVLISSNCAISSVSHEKPVARRSELSYAPVVVEDDVWLGMGAIVLPGCTIGAGAIVGAGSVVTSSLEPHGVYVGSPARRVGDVPI